MDYCVAVWTDWDQILYRVYLIRLSCFGYRQTVVNVNQPFRFQAVLGDEVETADLARYPVMVNAPLASSRATLVGVYRDAADTPFGQRLSYIHLFRPHRSILLDNS